MVILEKINPFWDDEFKSLTYKHEQFNSQTDLARWRIQGYGNKITGDMCDMRSPQPSWNDQIVNYFSNLGWQDIGTSYYRMTSGTVLPVHVDTYKKYIELFNIKDVKNLRRALIFLEDWSSGHYLEVDNQPILNWSKGDYVVWYKHTPHMAANLGLAPRYTLQVTGHVCE